MSGKIDKPTILNTLTTVGVWNGYIFYLAAPVSPNFSVPPNTLTTVGVYIFYLLCAYIALVCYE